MLGVWVAVSGARGRDKDMVIKNKGRDPCADGIVCGVLTRVIQKPVCGKTV